MEITKQDVLDFLKNNEADAKEITSSFFTKENVEEYLGTDEGKKLLQPKLDKYHSTGLKTWKENNLSKLVEAEIQKQFPAETEEQKLIRQLKQENELLLQKEKRTALVNYANGLATEFGVNPKLVERFVGKDEAETKELMELYKSVYHEDITKGIDAKLQNTDNTPGQSKQNQLGLTKEAFNKLGYSERVRLFQENPNLYAELSK